MLMKLYVHFVDIFSCVLFVFVTGCVRDGFLVFFLSMVINGTLTLMSVLRYIKVCRPLFGELSFLDMNVDMSVFPLQ